MEENIFDNLPIDLDEINTDNIAKQLLADTDINNYQTAKRIAETMYNMKLSDLSKNVNIEFKENNVIDVKIIATKSIEFLNIPISISPSGTNS
jgi:hypothetical protein